MEISNTKMGKKRQGGQRKEIILFLCQDVQSYRQGPHMETTL